MESNSTIVGSLHSNPNIRGSEEDRSLQHIDRYIKRLSRAMFRAKAVQHAVPNPDSVDKVVSEGERLIKELNTLAFF
jgi:hypothetical protein